jgi:hypothetical protein
MESDDEAILNRIIEQGETKKQKEQNESKVKIKRKLEDLTPAQKKQWENCQEAKRRNVERRKLAKQGDLVPPPVTVEIPPSKPTAPVEPVVATNPPPQKEPEKIIPAKKTEPKEESDESDMEDFLQFAHMHKKYKKLKEKVIKEPKRKRSVQYETESDSESEDEPPPPPKRNRTIGRTPAFQRPRQDIFFA